MRLFTKIFTSVILVFSMTFLVSGYFILSYSMRSSVEREKAFALQQYKYDKFTVQAEMIANKADMVFERIQEAQSLQLLFGDITKEVSADCCILADTGEILYSEGIGADLIDFSALSADSYWYRTVQEDEESFILIGSRFSQDDLELAFLTKTDITEPVLQQKTLQRYFERCFYVGLGAGVLLILILSYILTNPLNRMTKAADRIADGCYHERLKIRSKDEMGRLAESFNRMTGMVEKTIKELSDEAEKKEDFVANFAHELKTPLTSIIGYADMIYQKDMPREKVKKAGWYIWNEGMRLEALALKLMDLTNLNRQEFPLTIMSTKEILEAVMDGIRVVLKDRGIHILMQAEDAYIKVDYDLMKTLLINLIDNSVKADCKRIWVDGVRKGDFYSIAILDDGRGIPVEELTRITEAFYMVDKSYSRKQHGAGLGLALVKRIAEIHGGKLSIQSKEGAGTRISVSIPWMKEDEENA